jgi:monoamine oxidase
MAYLPRVVVVGAGASGLAAAVVLYSAGCAVTCLEARDRVGGRLLSVTADDGALDVGATWFWAGETRVESLVSRFQIPVFAQHLSGRAVFQDAAGVLRLPDNPFDAPALRYADGADIVARRLAAGLPPDALRLDSPVTAIRDLVGELEVEIGDGETRLRAEHVVLAVPPALAVQRIALPDALSADLVRVATATPVWMGAVVKVVAVYQDAFWREQGLSGAAMSRVGPLQEIHDMTGPDGRPAALFGFAAAPVVPSGFREAVLAQLGALFGPAAGRPTQLIVQDWSREEWTSPTGVHLLRDYELFGHGLYQKPAVDGRLHWASTETAVESAGHVEGALAAGQRAADAVLSACSIPR